VSSTILISYLLIRVMRECLGGNCKTSLIATVRRVTPQPSLSAGILDLAEKAKGESRQDRDHNMCSLFRADFSGDLFENHDYFITPLFVCLSMSTFD
jgi:hypothetical protein